MDLVKSYGSNYNIYDYILDDTAKTITINTYELGENGEWSMISGGGGFVIDSPKGRFGLSFNEIGNGVRTAFQNGNKTTASENKLTADINTNGLAVGTAYEENVVPVECHYC